jgi:hypothetical protein
VKSQRSTRTDLGCSGLDLERDGLGVVVGEGESAANDLGERACGGVNTCCAQRTRYVRLKPSWLLGLRFTDMAPSL